MEDWLSMRLREKKMRIEGSTVLVTGAASGLGLATAKRLVAAGASVVLIDREEPTGGLIQSETGDRAIFFTADITDPSEFAEALNVAEGRGPLRAVVHCAGRGGDRQRVVARNQLPGDLSSFQEILRVNLAGSYNVLCLAAARMSRNEVDEGDRGCVVLTSSVAAFEGQIGQTAYAASKAGVNAITLVAARDLASWKIRVNAIAPGTFETAMLGRLSPEVREGLEASIPHPRRLGDPDDYAHLALALIENEYINGETIRLDGGLRMAAR
jgi:NAD(P)-dependent dehydrogenase (short-subunit alcohol dehydrogenase family)